MGNMSRKTLVLQKPHKSPLPVQNLLKRQRKMDGEPQGNCWVAAMFAGVVVGGVVGGAAGGSAPRRMQPERGLTRSVERKRNESTRSEVRRSVQQRSAPTRRDQTRKEPPRKEPPKREPGRLPSDVSTVLRNQM